MTFERIEGGEQGEERDELLLCLDRHNRDKSTQLRVSLRTFNGHPFIDVRQWVQGANGFVPTGKGTSVKPRELAQVIEALRKALTLTGEPPPPPPVQPGPAAPSVSTSSFARPDRQLTLQTDANAHRPQHRTSHYSRGGQ